MQVIRGISDKTTQVFQGMLLFLILACDTLIRYRIQARSQLEDGQGGLRSARWKPSKPSF